MLGSPLLDPVNIGLGPADSKVGFLLLLLTSDRIYLTHLRANIVNSIVSGVLDFSTLLDFLNLLDFLTLLNFAFPGLRADSIGFLFIVIHLKCVKYKKKSAN